MKTKVTVAADSFLKIFQSIASSWASERQLLKDTCGISTKDCVVPVRERVSVGVTSQELASIGNMKSPSKIVKIGAMSESLSSVDGNEYGSTQAVAKTFNVSHKAVKRLIYDTADGKTKSEMAAQKKRKDVFHTEWPEKVSDFCLTKPICRE